MKANQVELFELITIQGNVNYCIPEYQRAYSWQLENWEQFFDDLDEDDSKHFLGSIINLMVADSDSAISDKAYELIDGQQRLTTVSILLIAIHNVLSKKMYEEDDIDQTLLDNIKSQIIKKLRVKDKEKNTITRVDIDDKYYSLRFFPSTQANNRDDYIYLLKISGFIDDNLNQLIEPKYFSARKFYKAYKYFCERLEVKSIENLEIFYKKMWAAQLINITVESTQDAFRLFDTLNNRGMPLSAIDIIKSKILSVLVKKNHMSLTAAYNKWKVLADSIEGVETRFLRQYYNAFRFDKNIQVENINQATQSQLIKIYENIIDRNAKYLFDDLYKKSTIYKSFLSEEVNGLLGKEILEFKFINTAPTYTILMYLLSLDKASFEGDYEKTLVSILKFLQKFAIRRNLTDFPRTRALDGINIDAIEACNEFLSQGGLITQDLIKNSFNNKKYNIATDEQVKESLLSENFYENSMSRYLLIKIDEHWSNREYKPNFWERNRKGRFVWTIEHIMPQTLTESWEKMLKTHNSKMESVESIHLENLHRIGNLTL